MEIIDKITELGSLKYSGMLLRERQRINRAIWRLKNPDREKATKKRNYDNNRDYYREKSRQWRVDNPDQMRRNNKVSYLKRKQLALEIQEFKTNKPCTVCNNYFPSECLDFDHIDPSTKTACVGAMVAKGYNKDTIFKEIAKCVLICACCHRIKSKKQI